MTCATDPGSTFSAGIMLMASCISGSKGSPSGSTSVIPKRSSVVFRSLQVASLPSRSAAGSASSVAASPISRLSTTASSSRLKFSSANLCAFSTSRVARLRMFSTSAAARRYRFQFSSAFSCASANSASGLASANALPLSSAADSGFGCSPDSGAVSSASASGRLGSAVMHATPHF